MTRREFCPAGLARTAGTLGLQGPGGAARKRRPVHFQSRPQIKAGLSAKRAS